MTFLAARQAAMGAGPAPVNLGSTAPFVILSGAAITTTGGGTVTGNAGASPIAGSAIHLTAAQVKGTIYAVDSSGPTGSVVAPSLLSTAKGDLTTAYNDAAGRSPTPTGPFLNPGSGNIGGLNLVPGLYKFTGTGSITGANVTLTGGPNDVWIFQVAADLEVGSSVQVILAGGAQAGNVFWQVGTSATIGTFASFQGTILASQAVSMDTSSTIVGRALAFTAGVTFDGASATLPTPEYPNQVSLQVNLGPSNAITAGAQWQVDAGAYESNGMTVTDLSPGNHTIWFTPIAGWITPANLIVTITNGAVITNGLYALTGTAPVGQLTVTLQPTGAVSANAQWQVDGGAYQNSGATVTNLAPGPHSVSFTSIAGSSTPATEIVTISSNVVATATGIYTNLAAPSQLNVTLLPAAAVSAGAQWQLDGGTNQLSGASITNLTAGGYTVSFTTVFGWITPPDQTVTITNGQTAAVTGLYSATNSFVFARGIYNGLFSVSNGVAEQTAGMLKKFALGSNGIYTGTLLINGSTHAVHGTFDSSGRATNVIPRATSAGGPLTVELSLSGNPPAQQLTGTISGIANDSTWVAVLLADHATNMVPAAEYTVLLPPDASNAPPVLSPGGAGYLLITNYVGTLKNPAAATVRISGALADGTLFSQSAPLSDDAYLPVYVSLYGGKGLLTGWINLNSSDMAGVSLTWIRPAHSSGMYKEGFTNVLRGSQILISPWTNPPVHIDDLTNFSMLGAINDANTLMSYTLNISKGYTFTEVSDPKLVSGSIDPKTGIFEVVIGLGGTRRASHGAILQNGPIGLGYFLNSTNAEAIELQP